MYKDKSDSGDADMSQKNSGAAVAKLIVKM